ncbi:hypothetical protein TGAM01_v202605 [Trichoderma gamsii]|uniref:Zn(2)-C6 fungal-type domain-containing protein n=1 Tax=Trichoderma gamsii TaxID=398673 RepID=A0A2P4ZWV7_9HYPO|nr:hypothetical protein TGAM01_v202605 [Trichoderma gamsii]PON28758.1 hypothetical protein TGAM01_v202605 [Trichoderma gamsii]
MRLGSQRVHGCKTCKRRKIKCDNKQPHCSQCIRLKQPCLGTTQGLIFIHSVNGSQTQQELARRDQWHQQADHIGISASISSSVHNVVSRMALEIASYHTCAWTPHPWLMLIPQLSLSVDFQSIMLLPFQAMMAAFSALPSNDVSLRAVAYRYYSSGLECHQAQFHQLVPWQKHQHSASILNLLLMSMALLEFEMMAPLGTDSWLPYAHGVLSLLEQVGLQGCQVSPFFEIFWQLRFFMSYIALSTRRTSLLGTREWMEIPFLCRGKTEFDRVIDTLLLLGSTLMEEDDEDTKTGNAETISKSLSGNHSAESASASSSQIAGSEQIIRLLVNLRELVSAQQSDSFERQVALSTAILEDSNLLLSQPSLPFNVSLQVISAMKLVVQYAPDSIQRQDAAQLYADWHGRLLLMA